MNGENFEQRQDEILKDIPEEFHSAVKWHAYDRGHAYGHEEVLIHVQNLVDMLKDPIIKYTERLTKNNQTAG